MNLNQLIFWWSLRKRNLNFLTAILAPANSKVSSFHFSSCSDIEGLFIVFRIFFTEMKVSISIYADRSYNKHFCPCSPTSNLQRINKLFFYCIPHCFQGYFCIPGQLFLFGEQKISRGRGFMWFLTWM